MEISANPVVQQDPQLIFEQLEAYDWNDPEFLSGLNVILDPIRRQGAGEEQIQHVTERAKVFYFSNKIGVPITHEQYKSWKSGEPTQPAGQGAPSQLPDQKPAQEATQPKPETTPVQSEPYPASFDKIVELITTGRTDEIPGIKDIPLKINEEPPTEAKLAKRSKPWEQQGTEPGSV